MAMNTTAILILAAGAAIIGGAIFLKPKEDEPLLVTGPGITEGERPPGYEATVILPPAQIVQVQAAPYMDSVTAI